MSPTISLDGPAREFWERHAERLTAAGLLTDADVDSFTVLCIAFAKLAALAHYEPGADNFREMVQLVNAQKQYHAFAKQFGLLPQARKAAKLEVAPPPKRDEFDL